MANEINLKEGQRAERKLLITVAEWDGTAYGGTTEDREILGTRTEDSSIEYNPDVQTSTDIRGITYTDVNKTEPSQSFDPYYLIGGSKLGAYLTQAALKNDIQAYNNTFTVYIITAFIGKDGAHYAYRNRLEATAITPFRLMYISAMTLQRVQWINLLIHLRLQKRARNKIGGI